MKIFVKKFQELTNVELYEILKARVDIFIVEQNCVYKEIDRIDYESLHVFSKDKENNIMSYLRIYRNNSDDKALQIGRVLSLKRNSGYATMILNEAISLIKDMKVFDKIYIEAQVYAVKFYEKIGFKTVGEEFVEDGIRHIGMEIVFDN